MPNVNLDKFEPLLAGVGAAASKSAPPPHPDIVKLIALIKKCPLRGDGTRTVSLEKLADFQKVIWQVGAKDDEWQMTKRRYAEAFMYLVGQLYLDGPSTTETPALAKEDALLLGEYKANWMQMILSQECRFWHRSAVEPKDLLMSKCISPRYASEVCIPDGGLVGDWPYGCKFVFTVKAAIGGDDEPIISSGGKLKTFGFGKYSYLIRQPGATRYMSDRVVPGTRDGSAAQVAFPDAIPLNRITVYEGNKKVDPHPWPLD